MSMDVFSLTNALAKVTKEPPGPIILSTCGIDFVPNDRAAIACEPPVL